MRFACVRVCASVRVYFFAEITRRCACCCKICLDLLAKQARSEDSFSTSRGVGVARCLRRRGEVLGEGGLGSRWGGVGG